MSSLNSPSRAILVAALTGLLTITSLTGYAKTPEPPGLISYLPQTTLTNLPKSAIKGKSRLVKVDKKMLRKGRFFIKLPGNISYEAVRVTQQERSKGQFGWIGHASDDPESRVVFGVSGDSIAGTFSYRGKLFRLEPRANGSHILSEIKPTDPAPEQDPIAVADTVSTITTSGTKLATAADANGAVIDVLVAYTPAVRTLYGTTGAEAMIIQAAAEANQAYANSGMSTRLNLVRTVLTNYVESGDMGTDLSRLRATSDGYMDELHSLRNTYGADLVNLIENEPQYCGLAYRMATLSSSFASSAFSVVNHSCATGYYSFAHELGHNQGAHHDASNASGAIFPYAYGYQDPNSAFRTIMAYNCPGGCSRISHFSNADIFYNGAPTGYVGAAENADAIDMTALTVASFRQGTAPAIPAAPSGLSASGISASEIDLTWTDQSNNESGFSLERSTNGLNFTQIASLPVNTTSYRDGSLTANTLYYYRARAWNSSGNSGYSNVPTEATYAAPQYIDQFAVGETSGGGSVTGTFQDTKSKDGVSESIKEISSGGTKNQRYSYLEHYWAIPVQPGASITLNADVLASSTKQTFTFAYSTSHYTLAANPTGWIDMFSVYAWNSGQKQFTLPPSPSGWIFISVRDNTRVKGVNTADSLQLDYLTVRTTSPSQ